MGGTKCLRLGTCELEYMGGVLQNDSSITRGKLVQRTGKRDLGKPASAPYAWGTHAPCEQAWHLPI